MQANAAVAKLFDVDFVNKRKFWQSIFRTSRDVTTLTFARLRSVKILIAWKVHLLELLDGSKSGPAR